MSRCAGATRPPPLTWWSAGSTRWACKTRPFSGPSRAWPSPPRTGGSTSTSPPSGCTSTRTRWPLRSTCPPDKVRLTLSGVGGAFGAREDLSLQIHLCLLALRTGRPVKMVYSREESFFGHVHRHPARLRYTHGADRQGRLVFVKAEIVLDGGAYMSSSRAVVANAGTLGVGPYDVPNVSVDAWGAYTNNPPCGAMRGFGAVQACFAYESQMDKLAEALGLHPVEVRARNAMAQGSGDAHWPGRRPARPGSRPAATGAEAPLPSPSRSARPGRSSTGPGRSRRGRPGQGGRLWPGGVANTTHGEGVVRGIGYAVGFKNVGLLRGVRRLLDGPGDPQLRRRAADRLGPHGGVRGRAGGGRRPGPDRPHRTGHRAGGGGDGGHPGGQRRVVLGLSPDVYDRRRGASRLPRSP